MAKWYKSKVTAHLSTMAELADMFRYDSAYTEQKPAKEKEGTIYTKHRPTIARWASFSASVENLGRCIKPPFKCWTIKRIPEGTGDLVWIYEQPA